MKFRITRTSTWDQKPIKEAKKVDAIYHDIRTIILEKMQRERPDLYRDFMSEGANHRTAGVESIRDLEHQIWMIEISSLEELLDLHDKYGEFVITSTRYPEYPIEIEIYDDWRE